jgi:hypothetical protein
MWPRWNISPASTPIASLPNGSLTNATNYVFVFLFEQTAAFDHGQLKVNFSGRHPFYEVHQPHAGLLAQRWKPTGFRFNGSRNSLVEPFVDT